MTDLEIVLLKETPRRSVRLELEGGVPLRVVKRVPAEGLLGLRARRLARREFEVQKRLHAAGLAVPEALAFTTLRGAVELVQRWVPGAVELAELLHGARTSRATPERLARALGTLLGRAHGLGLDHPDLHEKNVLVDADGAPWLIDFHGARLARGGDAERARRDLVVLAAATRERVSVRLRQRALVAWARAADERSRGVMELGTLAAELEHAARGRRRSVLARATKRWERPSSSARAFELARGGRGMTRAELDDRAVEELLARAWDGPRFEWSGELADLGRRAAVHALARLEPARVAAAFVACARLADHAISAARPVLHLRAPECGALVALPLGTRPIPSVLSEFRLGGAKPADACRAERRRVAEALGALFGALEDRGLALELRGGALHAARTGPAWALPPFALAERPLDGSGTPWRAGLAHLPAADGEERAAFARAWLAEQRGGAAASRALAERLASDLGLAPDALRVQLAFDTGAAANARDAGTPRDREAGTVELANDDRASHEAPRPSDSEAPRG